MHITKSTCLALSFLTVWPLYSYATATNEPDTTLSTSEESSVPSTDSGAYLTARYAGLNGDFETAATGFTRALIQDTQNPLLLENTIVSQVASGQLDAALITAQHMQSSNINSQVSAIVLFTHHAKNNEWNDILELLDAGLSVDPLVDGAIRAWALFGTGDVKASFLAFEALIKTPEWTRDITLQYSYALALAGDFETAFSQLKRPNILGILDLRSLSIAISIFSRLETKSDGELLGARLPSAPTDPQLIALKTALDTAIKSNEQLPFPYELSAQFGISDVLYRIAHGLHNHSDTAASYPLIYAQSAHFLAPDDTDIAILKSRLFDSLERYDLSQKSLQSIAPDAPQYLQAQRSSAEALSNAGDLPAAIKVLDKLVDTYPNYSDLYLDLGRLYGQIDQPKDANAAYTKALDLLKTQDDTDLTGIYYARAITYYTLDQWNKAEADFRAALKTAPNNPHILNYLGYSLVERGEKLDEALGMIERAVSAEPRNGAIIDSLAWVYYKLGRYDDAVLPMERAATLEPVDPIILDHLGDIYWAVGRKLEARFQWKRALSFSPDPELATSIRGKIDNSGL